MDSRTQVGYACTQALTRPAPMNVVARMVADVIAPDSTRLRRSSNIAGSLPMRRGAGRLRGDQLLADDQVGGQPRVRATGDMAGRDDHPAGWLAGLGGCGYRSSHDPRAAAPTEVVAGALPDGDERPEGGDQVAVDDCRRAVGC